ncbi:MAG TPA: hypothetical protein VFE14_12050 [Micromonosporaceae bacterium]|nr:hypothetical protein [Micromonosporaceae bacterium]
MRTTNLSCAVCARVTRFEQPPCTEGHANDCPEWTCTRCGEAMLVGPPSPTVEDERKAA